MLSLKEAIRREERYRQRFIPLNIQKQKAIPLSIGDKYALIGYQWDLGDCVTWSSEKNNDSLMSF